MANSKKKAVTKPAAKKTTAPAKKTATAKTPAKPNATKPVATKKTVPPVKKPTAKTPAKKPAVAPKLSPKSAKSAAQSTSTAKGNRLQIGKASAAKTSAKPSAAKKGSQKKHAAATAPVAAPTVKKAVKKSAATAPPPAKNCARRPPGPSAFRSASSVRRTASGVSARSALAAEPLPSGKKLRTPPARPVSFTLDEVRAIAQSNETKSEPTTKTSTTKASKKASTAAAPAKALKPADIIPPAKPSHVKAASLADILGFNPNAKGTEAAGPVPREVALVPEKFKRYYKLLVELREHLTGQIDQHSEDTLKRSSKDDAGDLSSYGQHMADAGTDTFDRDFALSLVSSEQEALSEIEAAIKRITDGSYGICEVSGQPIAKARLLAVPFTRYSAEAQKEIERNHYRVRTQAGLFGELGGEDGGKIMDADGD